MDVIRRTKGGQEKMNWKELFFFVLGFFIVVISIVQWMFLYPDPSQLMLGSFLGLVYLIVAVLMQFVSHLLQKVSSIEQRLDSLVYAKKGEQELKAVKRRKK